MNLLAYLNKKIYLYVFKEIVQILLLSIFVLTFIMVISRIGQLTDLIINKGVEIKDILLLIVYSSPPYLTFTLPMSFLLSTIVVLGRLSTENEVLALKASGINLKYLFIPVVLIGFLISFLGVLNTVILLPNSGNLFRQTLINVVKKGITIEDREGIFNDNIPGVVIYIDKVDKDNKRLSGILVSDDRDRDIKQMISANRGIIHLDPVTLDLNFLLEDGNLHRWEKKKDIYRNLYFKQYTFSMNLEKNVPQNVPLRKRPYEMDTKELKKAMINASALDRYDIMLEIFKKFSIPLSSISFMFLAVPLGIRRRVEGKFSGILYSLLLFILYYVLMAFTENMGKTLGVPAFITSFMPNIVVILIGLGFLRNLNFEEYTTISEKIRHRWKGYIEKTK
ncbi:MAG TPA: LptF/LptG family permease [Syntrophorhabdaceae bacterium]|nr:LptF/LptG family permease [Syntrophorhabdaceae bacterium]HOL05840.1 LptF/LptG family permease [Syntrophorhabdaceae bacterium]HON86208.1 LptF/LptG family permease [Syntrophorhabdaceae bacterium]HOT42021.1 LptF/LptG family permease [Syntrophorhabdaceae bacterium]HPC67072.1 LptF/LptG family permease [Syntrophorhabdaceae bacterium]